MARRYSRDNRGRFASGGGGATARGGRLATAAGNKRKTQTMKAEGGQPKNTLAKRQKVVPTTAKDRAGVAEVKRRKGGKLNAEDRMMDKAMKAAYPGVPVPGGRTMMGKPAAQAKGAPKVPANRQSFLKKAAAKHLAAANESRNKAIAATGNTLASAKSAKAQKYFRASSLAMRKHMRLLGLAEGGK